MPGGAPADGAEKLPFPRNAAVGARPPVPDGRVGLLLPGQHHPREVQPAPDVRDGLDEGGQELEALFLVRLRELDQSPFLQRIQEAFHQSTPNLRKYQVFTKWVRVQYRTRNPKIHAQ